MEQYYSDEQMIAMYRDYLRDTIVKKLTEMSPDSGTTLTIYGRPTATTIDFYKDTEEKVHVWSYPRIIGMVGTVKVDSILSDIKIHENELRFIDNYGLTFLWLEPDSIHNFGWD